MAYNGATGVTINNYSSLSFSGNFPLANNTTLNNISQPGSAPAAMTINGNLTVTNGTVNNSGTGSTLIVNGAFNIGNGNTITNGAGASIQISGNLINQENSIFSNAGTLTVSGNTTNNNAQFNNTGSLSTSGTFTNNNNGQFTNDGTLSTNGTFSNNTGQFANTGSVSVTGIFTNNNGSTLTNGGFINASGNFNNSASIINTNSGSLTVANNSNMTNTGTGSITNTGSINITGNYVQGQTQVIANPSLVISAPGAMSINGNFTMNQGSVTLNGGEVLVNGNYTQNGGTVAGTIGTCSRFSVGGPLGTGVSRVNGGTFGNNTPIRMCDNNGSLPVFSNPYPAGANGGFNVVAGGTVNPSVTAYTSCPSCNQPLPVTFVYVRGAYIEGQVKINWATASEENNDYFTIERSTDGKEFTAIATIDGAGNSSNVLSYEFIDNNPAEGVAYYRIKQTDFDEKFAYSRVVSINTSAASTLSRVFPNPVSHADYVQVAITDEKGGDIFVTVYDRIGKQCYAGKFSTGTIPSVAVKDFSSASGIYILQARQGNSMIREKLVVQ
ncbi:hypothetical protein [Xanthocytophaga agilis]|uniref:T9SS type A sorting domain-containing protein n=1 Tax=Xanthocytophaga agilis TaxID=3048010 RepID=UPI0028D522B6|nr:hypothetical protein [Xanthocytophaga agilis]